MTPMAAWLREALGSVSHRSPSVPMFSTISHQLVMQPTLDAAHWSSGLRRPVDFAGGVQAALDAGCRAFIDVAPHPVLGSAVRECAEQVGFDVVAVASLRRGRAEREQMLLAAGELF
jgi:acyl transferase domain-containing protein